MSPTEISHETYQMEDFNVDDLLKDASESLKAALSKLAEEEKLTIIFRFYRGLSQEQTAEILNLTPAEISRLERTGSQRLRNYMISGGIEDLHKERKEIWIIE